MANKVRGRWSKKKQRELDRVYDRYVERRARKAGQGYSVDQLEHHARSTGHATRSTRAARLTTLSSALPGGRLCARAWSGEPRSTVARRCCSTTIRCCSTTVRSKDVAR